MKLAALSAALALLAIETSAQASGSCKSGVIDIELGGRDSSYILSIPEDGRTVPITNPLIVYSITPPYFPLTCATNCTFIGDEGRITYYDGNTVDVDGPQAQLSVSCTTVDAAEALCITATSLDASQIYACTVSEGNDNRPTTTSVPPITRPISSSVPPYPIGVGSVTVTGTGGPSASASQFYRYGRL